MKAEKRLKREYYDRFNRDQESKRFYQSASWQKLKQLKLARDPCCETCAQAETVRPATLVHHMIPVKKGTKKLDLDFLVSLCIPCHNSIESEMEKEGNR